MNKAAQAYFQTQVSTTDQGQLLLMLYDGALNFIQQAREKIIQKDFAAKGILISKVIDIVNELSGSLNLERGGSLAENLNNLYFLCTARLLQANLKMDLKQLDSVRDILSGLRSAYAEIINTPEAKKAAAQISAKMRPEASLMQRAIKTSNISTSEPVGQVGQMQARAAYGSSMHLYTTNQALNTLQENNTKQTSADNTNAQPAQTQKIDETAQLSKVTQATQAMQTETSTQANKLSQLAQEVPQANAPMASEQIKEVDDISKEQAVKASTVPNTPRPQATQQARPTALQNAQENVATQNATATKPSPVKAGGLAAGFGNKLGAKLRAKGT